MTGNSVLSRLRSRKTSTTRAILADRAAAPLHAMLASAGRERRNERGYDWDGLQRPCPPGGFALLQHTFSGRGRLLYEGREHLIRPGQTMLLFFPHPNRYWTEPGDAWEFFFICVYGSEVMPLWRLIVDRLGPIVELKSDILENAAAACTAVIDEQIQSGPSASAVAYGLTMTLLDDLSPVQPVAGRNPAITRVLETINSNLHQPLSVEQLAAASGYSRWHFSRLFQRELGMSPAAYVLNRRITSAAQLLHSTHLPIKQIARRCGFTDVGYFAKTFRRFYHVSPSGFRNSGMYRQ
jgi:AraC-like DNA-binding protein